MKHLTTIIVATAILIAAAVIFTNHLNGDNLASRPAAAKQTFVQQVCSGGPKQDHDPRTNMQQCPAIK